MPSKATAGADWSLAAVEMAMPGAVEDRTGPAHPRPEDVVAAPERPSVHTTR